MRLCKLIKVEVSEFSQIIFFGVWNNLLKQCFLKLRHESSKGSAETRNEPREIEA